MAEHIAMLYQQRKKDGVFFLGTEITQEWLQHVTLLEQSLLRSSSPVFMPREYSNMVELRLDSNIIFYEKDTEDKYNLMDIFAVKGDNPVGIEIGSWRQGFGVQLGKRKNRWERRTDMMGATIQNTPWENGHWSGFIYSQNGTIIGSKGWYQDMLNYVVGGLNFTIEIVQEGPRTVCGRMLYGRLTDVCSGGYVITEDFAFSLGFMKDVKTLFAGVPTGTAPDAWVYIQVFGWLQWIVLVSVLLVISLLLSLTEASVEVGRRSENVW